MGRNNLSNVFLLNVIFLDEMEFEITSDQRTGKPIACRVVRLEAGSVSFEVCSPSVFDCLCLLVVQLYISQPHVEQKVKYSVYVDSFTFFHFLHAGMTMDNRRQKLLILLNTPHPNVNLCKSVEASLAYLCSSIQHDLVFTFPTGMSFIGNNPCKMCTMLKHFTQREYRLYYSWVLNL